MPRNTISYNTPSLSPLANCFDTSLLADVFDLVERLASLPPSFPPSLYPLYLSLSLDTALLADVFDLVERLASLPPSLPPSLYPLYLSLSLGTALLADVFDLVERLASLPPSLPPSLYPLYLSLSLGTALLADVFDLVERLASLPPSRPLSILSISRPLCLSDLLADVFDLVESLAILPPSLPPSLSQSVSPQLYLLTYLISSNALRAFLPPSLLPSILSICHNLATALLADVFDLVECLASLPQFLIHRKQLLHSRVLLGILTDQEDDVFYSDPSRMADLCRLLGLERTNREG